MEYAEKVYQILKEESEGLDALYESFIKDVVGRRGLEVLIKNKLVESCGVVNGRRLYTLCNYFRVNREE